MRLRFRRPMVGLEAAKAVTGLNTGGVVREIELGRIRWAFNLGASARRHVLILTRSLAGLTRPDLDQPESAEEVADVVLPVSSRASGNVRATDLQFALNLTSAQVMRLMRTGLLEESCRSRCRRGCGGTALITRASVVKLLKARRFY